jgi:Uma2 family endonuclease
MILQVMKSLSKSISLIHPLQPGDRLTRAEFERRFDLTRNLKRAELIEGVVYIPPPIGPAHGSKHAELGTWLGNYRTATPGTVSTITSSIRLDLDNEPQPDLALMIASEFGGNCRIDEDNFYSGAPELVAEISYSTVSFDLHQKKNLYRRHGVKEYLVWLVRDEAIYWFVLKDGEYIELADRDGVFDSTVFPGLRLDAKALLTGDLPGVQRALNEALALPEHQKFVIELQNRKTKA